MDDITWDMNEERIRQYWPTAMYPTELKALIKRRLCRLNQQWLAEALEVVKCKYSSHQPELKWFLEQYEVCEDRAWKHQPKPTTVKAIIVDHVRVRNGSEYDISTVFTVESEADDYARQVNGTIRGRRKAMSDDDLRSWLKSQSRAALQASVDVVRSQGWGEWQFPADLDQWTPTMLGAVAGGLDVMQRRSERAAVNISSQEAA